MLFLPWGQWTKILKTYLSVLVGWRKVLSSRRHHIDTDILGANMDYNDALELVALRHLMEGDTDKFKTCLPEQQPGGVEGRPQEDGHWINKVILEQGPAKNKTLLEVAIERGLYSFQASGKF